MTPTEIGRLMRAKINMGKDQPDGRLRFKTMAEYEQWKAQQELAKHGY